MLKYYLDKTGKVIKSILFPSSEFVDTEPREGSMNPVTSGGVAGSISQQSSNFAPKYSATSTYPANSYVMHDGKLYTNQNAIGPAEDWNPEDWVETSVGEFISKIKDPTALEVYTIENALPRNTRITALSCEFLFNPFTGECTCNGSFTLSGSQTLSKNSADMIQDYDSEYGLVAELTIDPNSYQVPILGRVTGSILSITASNAPAVPCVFIVDGSNTVGIIAAKSSFSVLSGGKYVCTTSIIKPS